MKTPQNHKKYLTYFCIYISYSVYYNKIERIEKFNRTHLIMQKRFDFLYSVDWEIYMLQLCYRNHLSIKRKI